MNSTSSATITKRARQTWEVMHREAKNRGMALTRDKRLGDGRVIVATVGAFIKGLNNERGWGLDQHEVDLVRRFLKTTGNVVVLNKIEQYKFRIFIREEWSDEARVEERETPARDDKISPQDAGEDREPAPVEYKCVVDECGATYDTQNALNAHKAVHSRNNEEKRAAKASKGVLLPTAYQQKKILRALVNAGGEIEHPRGLVNRALMEQDQSIHKESIGHCVTSLHNHGLIRRDGNLRRTYKIALTPKGRREVRTLFGPDVSLPPERADEGPKGRPPTPASSAPEPPAAKTEEASPPPMKAKWLTDQFLLDELRYRLTAPKVDEVVAKKMDQMEQRLGLIGEIVTEVNAGKLSPLKALGDIEEAMKL